MILFIHGAVLVVSEFENTTGNMAEEPRPKNDTTEDGRRIVYPIWRDDLAEATILPREKRDGGLQDSSTKNPPA